MDLSAPAASWALFWTITRFAALAVLATEAMFLLRRSRGAHAEGSATSRFFWSATPALILAGLSVWCLAALPPPHAPQTGAIADASTNLNH